MPTCPESVQVLLLALVELELFFYLLQLGVQLRVGVVDPLEGMKVRVQDLGDLIHRVSLLLRRPIVSGIQFGDDLLQRVRHLVQFAVDILR